MPLSLEASGVVDQVLDGLKLRSSVFSRLELDSGWGFAKASLPGAPFHIVIEGEAWLSASGEGGFERLGRGDLAILPRGGAHLLASSPDAEVLSFNDVWRDLGLPDWRPGQPYTPRVVRIGSCDRPSTRLVSGVFSFMDRRRNPLLSALPDVLTLRASEDLAHPGAKLNDVAALIDNEVGARMPGGALVVSRLADFLFVQAVRAHLASGSARDPGWLLGLSDPRIGSALRAIHSAPEAAWSVARLAQEAGMSRSSFALEFKRLVGRGPFEYLKEWRMFEAAALLEEGAPSIAEVAGRVGYSSEVSFSRAFKLIHGLTPGSYRRGSDKT
ncbi:AraC family transcriptional regulator [Sphingomonas sp. BK580]|uniref:AraC family transcriptional regulator n=1 Tax=Sphingomonas sp. BK580 TaxID=2586972 RepID=UPI00160C763B|nr:AraC family transcriptional regulator [Sphingomonas sp. BK580]MBB3695255.1 AraC-like DNA-binding protein [Sphingomonas sp. BK580]